MRIELHDLHYCYKITAIKNQSQSFCQVNLKRPGGGSIKERGEAAVEALNGILDGDGGKEEDVEERTSTMEVVSKPSWVESSAVA